MQASSRTVRYTGSVHLLYLQRVHWAKGTLHVFDGNQHNAERVSNHTGRYDLIPTYHVSDSWAKTGGASVVVILSVHYDSVLGIYLQILSSTRYVRCCSPNVSPTTDTHKYKMYHIFSERQEGANVNTEHVAENIAIDRMAFFADLFVRTTSQAI